MKFISRIIPALLVAATLGHGQNGVSRSTSQAASAPPLAARILGEIPDGTPPPPAPPKPVYQVAAQDVLSTVTHQQGGRSVTIREINPIDLPPPPPSAEISSAGLNPEFRARLAAYYEAHPRTPLLFLSATVFRSKDQAPRTLVRWWLPNAKGTITFWSSADFALIAGGITSFADHAGDPHSLVMGWGNVDIDRMAELYADKGREYDAPEMPDFPEGKATFEIVGDTVPTAAERLVIQSLHDLYNSEFIALKTAHQGRERVRIASEEHLKANPPQPKDITLNFWRKETPTARGKGASQ